MYVVTLTADYLHYRYPYFYGINKNINFSLFSVFV